MRGCWRRARWVDTISTNETFTLAMSHPQNELTFQIHRYCIVENDNNTHQNSFYCYIKSASRSDKWGTAITLWVSRIQHRWPFLHQWSEAVLASVLVCFDQGCVVSWSCVLYMWRHRKTKQWPKTKVAKATASAESGDMWVVSVKRRFWEGAILAAVKPVWYSNK